VSGRGGQLLVALGIACAGSFIVVYVVALHTVPGLFRDRLLFEHVSGSAAPQVRAAGERALRTIDVGSVVAAVVTIVTVAVTRGRTGRALAALGLIVCSVGSTEILKHGLPHIHGAIPAGRPATFPSGHTSIAVAIGFALVLAVPPIARVTAALVGAAYATGIGVSVVVLGWHYPSDVVGSFFVCGAWACVFARLLYGAPGRSRFSPWSVLVAVAAMAIAIVVAITIAERHPAAVQSLRTGRAVVETAALFALVSFALFGSVTALVEERREL